ncbi:hypothetical protein DYH10_00525 [Candidatus Saccharibacteria bacterium CPR2]|nr:hypothetical protein [Candidatus Saccharibacteria bacterium CPR2]
MSPLDSVSKMRDTVFMHIYFSGIGGVAIGPLALFAKDAGFEVSGSDIVQSRYTKIIENAGIRVAIGQTGQEIVDLHEKKPIDWLVATAALPENHPEINFARQKGIRISKRDEFLNYVIKEKTLKILAVAGTHGKTTTTGMLIWLFKAFGIPVSYTIGTNVSFGPSGQYQSGSNWFVYEADEFDRNFLRFQPKVSVITKVDYDHPDTYATIEDYKNAFIEFIKQSQETYLWKKDCEYLNISPSQKLHCIDDTSVLDTLNLPGIHNRENAMLAFNIFTTLFADISKEKILGSLNNFPGTERRFEKLAQNIYTDYAHHPTEIRAALQTASEVSSSILVVYQPHQNKRQVRLQDEYQDCFNLAKKVYWLPTYISREVDKNILTQEQLISKLSNSGNVQPTQMNGALAKLIVNHQKNGDLVLILGAGDVDDWIRKVVKNEEIAS